MPMTVVVTVNAPMKYRGFLASCMLELAPGVYSHPQMSAGIRQRLWKVMEKWYQEQLFEGSVLMIWRDSSRPGGQGISTIGLPQRTIVDCDGVLLSRLNDDELKESSNTAKTHLNAEYSDKSSFQKNSTT